MAARTTGPVPNEPVIVIGAGAAGLAAADALRKRGVPVVILERELRLAEPWRRRHQQLHLNTHRALSMLPGLAYPPRTPAFPHKGVIVDYLERFAAKRGLAVEFGTTVERIERKDGGWLVRTSNGTRHASHVIVATGRDRVPWIPDWDGIRSFEGRLVHAGDFGAAQAYAGKSVLVVGAGNSGFDVLNHLSRAGTGKIWLSARQGPSLLPKRIGSVAVHRFAGIMASLPTFVVDMMISATQRLIFGDLTRHGLPPAPKGGASRLGTEQIAIAVDDGAVAALKAGRITVVAPVASFNGRSVRLSDDNVIEPDVVIAATGYRSGLETMVGNLDVLDGKGVSKANGGTPTGQPGLWFIGMRPSLTSYFHSAGIQARAIARQIAKAR
ncbi:flavin-containing monooxygenase [Mesorhizobium sp.]|uniref:flavin-containing monooxygenase n=1 Tax=Mesorhizobium sp. TaxID=1871066 RepID=UPI003BA947CD